MCNSKIIVMTLALLVGGIGCAHVQTVAQSPTPDVPDPLPVPEAEALDDERILQITHVTNEAEIDAAKLAEARAPWMAACARSPTASCAITRRLSARAKRSRG